MKLFLQCSFALSLVDYPSHPWDGRRWVASRGGTEMPIAMDLGLSSECPLLDPGESVLSFPAEPQYDRALLVLQALEVCCVDSSCFQVVGLLRASYME